MSNATQTGTANDNGCILSAMFLCKGRIEAEQAEKNRATESARLAALALTHWKGAKHVHGRDVAQTAKMIRKDLAEACRASTGPLSGCVCRVTTRRASMMVAIDVEIVSIPSHGTPIINGRWVVAEDSGTNATGERPSVLSKRGAAMLAAAQTIVDAYNFNKSDSMTDYSHVGFYGSVTFDSDVKQAAIGEVRAAVALMG